MAPPGQPTRYKPEYAALARNYCQLGAINEELAGFFDVCRRTIDNWIATEPEFATAVRAGRAVADAEVAGRLHQRALGYTFAGTRVVLHGGKQVEVPHRVHYPADVRACIFWLRNRRPRQWNEALVAAAAGNAELEARLAMRRGQSRLPGQDPYDARLESRTRGRLGFSSSPHAGEVP